MSNNQTPQNNQLLSKLLILFGITMVGLFIGFAVGLLAVLIITKTDPLSFQQNVNNFLQSPQNYDNGWLAIMALQWFSALFGFIIGPIIYWKYIEKNTVRSLTQTPVRDPFLWISVSVLVVFIMPVNEWINTINHQIALPDALKWMIEKENAAEKMTKFLVNFQSLKDFFIGLIVIAGLAAVGEEITFRGILQNLLYKSTQNHHIAIWITAIIFSAIHMQFLGFFPRMLLGALFGYLYFWTNNLWIPILAHFTNNGFVLWISYLYQNKTIKLNPDNIQIEVIPTIISLIISASIVYWIYQKRIQAPQTMI